MNWVRPYIEYEAESAARSGRSASEVRRELGEVVVEQVDDEHDLVAARATAAQAGSSAEAMAQVTLLLAEVALAALALVHGVGGGRPRRRRSARTASW